MKNGYAHDDAIDERRCHQEKQNEPLPSIGASSRSRTLDYNGAHQMALTSGTKLRPVRNHRRPLALAVWARSIAPATLASIAPLRLKFSPPIFLLRPN